ncbi:MAG: STAS domain-containing protein [Proteobacteria bacterium]|nr:STAS domain-containing protein [Pseudomonadota bacterium]
MIEILKGCREVGDTVVLYPQNYINGIEGEKLEEVCGTFFEKGIKKFVIDFSETDIINSIGVSILIGIIEKIKESKGVVLFSGLNKVNLEVFRIVGLTKLIPSFATEADALEEMGATGTPVAASAVSIEL